MICGVRVENEVKSETGAEDGGPLLPVYSLLSSFLSSHLWSSVRWPTQCAPWIVIFSLIPRTTTKPRISMRFTHQHTPSTIHTRTHSSLNGGMHRAKTSCKSNLLVLKPVYARVCVAHVIKRRRRRGEGVG